MSKGIRIAMLIVLVISKVRAYHSPDASLTDIVEKRLGDLEMNPVLSHLHHEFQSRYDEIVARLLKSNDHSSESDNTINFKIDTMGLLVDIYDAANETMKRTE